MKIFHLILPEWGKVAQSGPTLCNRTDYTVHRILQAKILEWVAFPSSRGSSQPRDRTQVSRIAGRFFTSWASREAPDSTINYHYNKTGKKRALPKVPQNPIGFQWLMYYCFFTLKP